MDGRRTCIIVDDEPAAHYVLMSHIRYVSQLELVQQCYNAIEAINYLRQHPVDLMFLDINMPEISGMEMLKSLKNPPRTILTTAYSEYAMESYDHGVVDYLLKPINLPRFITATERYFELSVRKEPEKESQSFIMVKTGGVSTRIELDDILYAQSLGNFIRICTSQKTYIVSLTTSELEETLPDNQFLRIHKSFIVSLNKIHEYGKDTVTINDQKMPVGITYRQKLYERLK
ncbi:MAG: response regulator transcription factor [Sphingobacteriales bacterium]|nr:response regulator transcription factor [Sphingobacteriales bacterium]OJV97418.1 MAG: DNA-binding response regulator [Sphingobacteriales bacterium 44-61]